jgi:hypothetical protein
MTMRLLCLACILIAGCNDDGGTTGAHEPEGGSSSPDGGGASGQGGVGGVAAGGTAGLVAGNGTGGTAPGVDGGAGFGGSGGSPDAGNAGASGGGPAGSGGAGFGPVEFDSADHCSPGEYFEEGFLEADRAFGGLSINCYNDLLDQGVANGLGDNIRTVESIRLPESMRSGESTAISWELEVVGGAESSRQVEYWAAMSECGSEGSLQRFYAQQVPVTGVHCAGLVPDEAFAYILRVTRPSANPDARGGLTARGATVCMAGTCPAP